MKEINKLVESILDLVGYTPMVKLKRISMDIPAEVWGKLEFYNPSGSIKDRIALKMLEKAEKRNQINMDVKLVDEIVQVNEEAIATTHRLWKEEGLMCGISSGAKVFASLLVGKNMNEGEEFIP